jgi:hypothetical protein
MTIELTINLPEQIVEYAKNLAYSTQRDVSTVISDTLEMLLPTVENLSKNDITGGLSQLSDKDILSLANAKMDFTQNQRLGDLQSKGKITGLTQAEQYELATLIQIYQIGQLKKSEALAEAVKRGLKKPLSP